MASGVSGSTRDERSTGIRGMRSYIPREAFGCTFSAACKSGEPFLKAYKAQERHILRLTFVAYASGHLVNAVPQLGGDVGWLIRRTRLEVPSAPKDGQSWLVVFHLISSSHHAQLTRVPTAAV